MVIREVLSGKKNFSLVYNKGKSVGDIYVVVFYKKNDTGSCRLAFLASKKVGNAVKRNRARRLMKEGFRNLKDMNLDGYDIIFIARNTIDNKKCRDVERSMLSALKRTAIIKGKQ